VSDGQQEGQEASERERKEFLDLRRETERAEWEAAKGFDQAMLTLAGGALVLTAAYAKEIAPAPAPWSRWLLVFSRGGFAFALCFITFSYLATMYAARDRRRELDHQHNPEHPVGPPMPHLKTWYWWDRWPALRLGIQGDPGDTVDRYNIRAALALVIGVTFLFLYSVVNLFFGAKS
jgi:hypothetical protein